MDLKDMPNMPADNGIEQLPGGGVVCTGVGVDIYRILALRGMLEMEMAGLRRRGRSAFAVVKEEFGLRGNKERVYREFCKMHSLPTKDERKKKTETKEDMRDSIRPR